MSKPKNWKMSARAIAILVNKTKHTKKATAILGNKQNEQRPKNKPEKKKGPALPQGHNKQHIISENKPGILL